MANDMEEGEPWLLLVIFGHTYYPLLIVGRCEGWEGLEAESGETGGEGRGDGGPGSLCGVEGQHYNSTQVKTG